MLIIVNDPRYSDGGIIEVESINEYIDSIEKEIIRYATIEYNKRRWNKHGDSVPLSELIDNVEDAIRDSIITVIVPDEDE